MSQASLNCAAAGTKSSAGRYLTFCLGRESYAIPVLKVREIIRLVGITPVPQMPACIRGVINLRGKVVPVMDLRARFGLECADDSERTCIVVALVKLASGTETLLGLIVDAVEEVLSIAGADIEDTPAFGTGVDTAFLPGLAKVKGVVKALLDIDKLASTMPPASLPLLRSESAALH